MKTITIVLLALLAMPLFANDSYDAAVGLIKQQKYEPAGKLLQAALKDEDSPRVRYALGYCAEKAGKKEQAVEHYRRAVQRHVESQKGADEALRAIKKLVALQPKVGPVFEAAQRLDLRADRDDSKVAKEAAYMLYAHALSVDHYSASLQAKPDPKLRLNSIAYRKLTNEALFFYNFDRFSITTRWDKGTLVRDMSRHQYKGVCKNTKLVDGKVGQAMRFSGDSEIDMGDVFNEVGLPVTIAFWAKAETQHEGRILCTDQFDQRLYSGFELRHGYKARYRAAWGTARGVWKPHRRNISDYLTTLSGKWSHIVIVMEKDRSFRCYVNGKYVPTKAIGSADKVGHTKAPCKIGGNFIGDIDEIGMWKRALTPEEAKVLYAEGN